MRAFDSATADALSQRTLKKRDFVWFTAPTLVLRTIQSVGFWNDKGTVSAAYYDVNDGSTKTRNYTGSGALISIDDIPLFSDVSIRSINIKSSQLNQTTIDLVRQYDLKKAPIEIHRGMFNPGTWQLVAPAHPRFVGFIDKTEIQDPQLGNDGQITFSCVSHTRMLTRTNPVVRSGPSQRERYANDSFYDDTAVAGNWQVSWGQAKSSVGASPSANASSNANVGVQTIL